MRPPDLQKSKPMLAEFVHNIIFLRDFVAFVVKDFLIVQLP